jgi:hypothetical protein
MLATLQRPNLLILGQTFWSLMRRRALTAPADLARDLAREAQDWLGREGLSGTCRSGATCPFNLCRCTSKGQDGLAGTAAPSYGSEGWGFESLRARESAGHRLANRPLILGPTKFGTQVGACRGTPTRLGSSEGGAHVKSAGPCLRVPLACWSCCARYGTLKAVNRPGIREAHLDMTRVMRHP